MSSLPPPLPRDFKFSKTGKQVVPLFDDEITVERTKAHVAETGNDMSPRIKSLIFFLLACACFGAYYIHDKGITQKPEAEIRYTPPQPTRVQTPRPVPTPVPRMTVSYVNLHEWEVFIPESGKWFDSGIPVVVAQNIYVAPQNASRFSVQLGGRQFYSNYNKVSFYTNEFCEPEFPVDMRDTLKIRIEPDSQPATFRVTVSNFNATPCFTHVGHDLPENHFEMHRQAENWWEETQAPIGRG